MLRVKRSVAFAASPSARRIAPCALVAAASDRDERRARGEHAHTESRHYGWPAIARRLASLYEELLTPAQEHADRAGR